MKSLLATLALTTALTLPGLAMARPVTLTTTLNNYGGDGAYLALYVTDASGAYVGSLWMAGGKSKYYEHLTDWYRATGGDTAADQRHHRRQRRRGPHARDHARPGRCAVRCGLHAPHRRGRRGHARQPERGRRAADDRGRGHARARAPLRRQLRLRHVRSEGHDPCTPSLAGSSGPGSRHRPRARAARRCRSSLRPSGSPRRRPRRG